MLNIIERSTGGIQSNQEAIRWYRLATADSYLYAQFSLDQMYLNGEGG
ncbi:hypothetical protein [Candidatus Nitrosacidococcus tergens]|uniref:Sel1 domain protein repeat-containing protein n=1 Tax=Candidatus Nitrosacidococcus tergens TaxID=553981 RepID=A0A7G1Q852_9GAMM|nr:hypothetical protein [Candidatus Nitrosacidococcus tergens]CAB1274974.1 protein of unknown function [Candidatus Nitrosacidococcus tergens]